jgi:iron complex outermembrane receptor protein
MKRHLLLSTAGFAALAAPAFAQSTPEAADADRVVIVGESVARANNVVSEEDIANLAGAQNIIDAIKLVPGVQIRGADASNNDPWTYAINIRGFEVNLRNAKIGQTLDGVPLFNASYYLGGAPAQKYMITEMVESVQVNQGTADVGSPASAALGGTIVYASRDPSKEAGGVLKGTFGDYDSQRFMALYESGELFGNTRGMIAVSDLKTNLWPHNGATTAGIEQFHVAGKLVSEFGPLTVTAYGSYNDSDDDPIIEATRTFLNATGFATDGSSSFWNPNQPAAVAGIGGNENWADAWAAVRENTFGYLKLDWQVNDALSVDVTPYIQINEGIGEFAPPFQEPRFVNTATPGALRQVLYAGSTIRTTRANPTGRAVLPFATGGVERVYTGLDGVVVRSSECWNADNTPRVVSGVDVCPMAQSYRNSEYYHQRMGIVADGTLELGDHTIRGGVWYERLDRDFGRAWKPYLDIRLGPIALDRIYRRDFYQNFKTDLVKLHIADDWQVTDDLLISAGVQHYMIDIKGISIEGAQFNPAGQLIAPRNLAVSSDSQELLPSIGAVYELSDTIEVFAGYSKNFGAIGDWALEKTGTDLSNLQPEMAQNIEVGLRFVGDNLRASATAYAIDYDDAIVFLTNDFAIGAPGINYSAGTGGTYFNVPGGVESRGFEASVEYDLTDALTAYASASLINAEYTADFNAASYGGNGGQVRAGYKVAGTPEYILAGALNYASGPLAASLQVRHIGEAAGDAFNTASLFVPAYTLVDLSTRYRLELPSTGAEYLELGFAVNNLLDERYVGGMLDEFTQRYTAGAPRSVSFTAAVGF